eukprot:102218_1
MAETCTVSTSGTCGSYLKTETGLDSTCTDEPSPAPTAETVCTSDPGTFDWDELMTNGGDEIPVMSWDDDTSGIEYDSSTEQLGITINLADLSINIRVELEYLGNTTADDEDEANFGTTYVLDFEDYNAHKTEIYEPGTCQNRNYESFYDDGTLLGFEDWWQYSTSPYTDIGTADYLAYPPPEPQVGSWSVSMKDDDVCGTIVYEGKFTWSDLRDCTSFDGSTEYTKVVDDGTDLKLYGTFYINVVSPYWYATATYGGYYRVYQLLSQPFVISVSKTIHVLGSTGINLMTISVIAVYKEDYEDTFRLIL